MPKIIKLTASQLKNIITQIISEEESFSSSQSFTIQDGNLNNFYTKVKTQTKGKRIVLSSIQIIVSDKANSILKFETSPSAKPVTLIIPFSEETDKGRCPSCEIVKRKNPTVKLVKTGKFGKNRVFHIYALPTAPTTSAETPIKPTRKKYATKYSSFAVQHLKSERAENFRSQVYDDKCPDAPTSKSCGGNLTIGYGTLIKFNPELKKYQKQSKYHMSKAMGLKYMMKHLNTNTLPAIRSVIKIPLTQNQFDALTILVYNVGNIGPTLANAINTRNNAEIVKYWLKYAYSGGEYWPGLETRRKWELKLFFKK